MNIANQVAVAITGVLGSSGIPYDPTIIDGMSPEVNTETNSRIVVVAGEATLYKTSLPGVFEIKGVVHVIQSDDTDNSDTRLTSMTDAVESTLGQKYSMPDMVAGIDPELHLYTYNWLGPDLARNERKSMVSYNWQCIAKHSPNTERI